MQYACPDDDMLAAYASGVATTGVSLIVAAHATYCPECRDRLAALDRLGGAMLGREGEQSVNACALNAVMARLDDADEPAPDPAPRAGMLPAPVAAVVGDYADIRWRFVMPGVSRADLPADAGETVSLLRVRPGAGVPAHTHTGREATLVLSGALRDRGVVYGVGDLAIATSDDDHHPRAEPGADCVCLAVMTGSVRFTGPLARALNIFAE